MNTNILTPASKAREMAEQGLNIVCEKLLKEINDSILKQVKKGCTTLQYSIPYDLYPTEVITKAIHLLEGSGYSCSSSADVYNFNPNAAKLLIRW